MTDSFGPFGFLGPFGIPQVIDLVIALTLFESAALVLYHRVTAKGVAPREFLSNMISGICLMLALRCLARDIGATWTTLFLLAAGLAHGTDLLMRWRRSARGARDERRVTT